MNINDLEKVSKECIEGPYDRSRAITITGNEIERLYAIAFEAGRQAEREECAKVCQEDESGRDSGGYFAELIRERSTK